MSRPMNRLCDLPQLGDVDQEAGEFWVSNPFMMPGEGHNLSAYERNCLFMNLGGRDFMDVSFTSGVDLDSDSRSAVVGDFDRDGASDLLVASVGGGPLRLFMNQLGGKSRSVRLNLVGTSSNRMAIGARIVATVDGRQIVRDHFAPNGSMGQGPADTVIGLGEARRISKLIVRWPSGMTQTFDNLPEAKEVTLIEGEPLVASDVSAD